LSKGERGTTKTLKTKQKSVHMHFVTFLRIGEKFRKKGGGRFKPLALLLDIAMVENYLSDEP